MNTGTAASGSRTNWFQLLVIAAVTIVLVLQKTKQALLPRSQTPVLWAAELVTIAGSAHPSLRLGPRQSLGRGTARLGTLANNFYEPRREALINGWRDRSWECSERCGGRRRRGAFSSAECGEASPTRGLLDFSRRD